MNWWQGIVAGAGAVVAMTLFMNMGRVMRMTRMRLPVILGSMLEPDRRKAMMLGLMMHIVNGLIFGLIYAVIWRALGIDRFTIGSAWWIGLIFGVVHGSLLLFMMPTMSAMHPRVRAEDHGRGTGGCSLLAEQRRDGDCSRDPCGA